MERTTGETAGEGRVDARALAERLGYPFQDLTGFREDVALWQQVPMDLILRYRFVPLREVGGRLAVAVAHPERYRELDDLEMTLGRPLAVEVASEDQIDEILARNRSSAFLLDKASEELRLEVAPDEDLGDVDLDSEQDSSSPIIKLVHSLLVNGIERRASDIHVETKEEEVVLKYRIDGVLYPAMEPVDRKHHQTIVSRLKVMAELDVAERRVPQDGRFKLKIRGRPIDFRVSIMPSIYGEDVVVRILDKESISEQFSELRLDLLGIPESELKRFRKFIREPYGMVLVTGPTGSGKTTTLYAALSEIASPEAEDRHHRGPRRVPHPPHHPGPGEREEGPHLRPRAPVDPPPRSRHHHGRRGARPGDGDRSRSRPPDRSPRLHDRARQQRVRRHRPLPAHGGRALQLRLGAQLRHGAAARPLASARAAASP